MSLLHPSLRHGGANGRLEHAYALSSRVTACTGSVHAFAAVRASNQDDSIFRWLLPTFSSLLDPALHVIHHPAHTHSQLADAHVIPADSRSKLFFAVFISSNMARAHLQILQIPSSPLLNLKTYLHTVKQCRRDLRICHERQMAIVVAAT